MMTDVWMFRDDADGVPHKRDRDCADTCHPVALIDPEGPSANRLRDALGTRFAGVMSELRGILREFADPRPEEPTGLGAVVEDVNYTRWTRVESGEAETRNPWYPAHDPSLQPAEWVEIPVVRVLSEGVS